MKAFLLHRQFSEYKSFSLTFRNSMIKFLRLRRTETNYKETDTCFYCAESPVKYNIAFYDIIGKHLFWQIHCKSATAGGLDSAAGGLYLG